MQNEQASIENIIATFFEKHSKIKIGKIIAINKIERLCNIEFYEYVSSANTPSFQENTNQKIPILQNVPFFYTQYSTAKNTGIFIPYNENDNVLVAILDNFSLENLFNKNSQFASRFPHNLSNAVIIGHAPMMTQEIIYTGDDILIQNGDTQIEISVDKIDIKNNETSITAIFTQLTTAIKAITVNVMGVPTPINNIADFTAVENEINKLFK